MTRADNKEGSKVKIEVTRVNYGRDSLPFIQGKLLAEEEGELVGYDSGIEVKSEAGTPTPTTPVAEKRKREEEEEEEEVVESLSGSWLTLTLYTTKQPTCQAPWRAGSVGLS